MPLLVDTYNVIHVWRNAPLEEDGRDVAALAELVARSRFGGEKATLVCDGLPPGGSEARHTYSIDGVTIRYAGAGNEADDVIERLIQRDTAPRRLTVASSDRRVQRAARRRGAVVLASPAFISVCNEDLAASQDAAPNSEHAKATQELSDAQVDQWLKAFGFQHTRDRGSAKPSGKPGGESRPEPPADDPLDMSHFLDDVEPL
jgi:uncharacterized protein